MSKTLYDDVAYLEDFDFQGKKLVDSLENPDRLYILLIYSSRCHYCTEFIPMFSQLAKDMKSPDVMFVTIQADGELDTERNLGDKLHTIFPDFSGFPTLLAVKEGNQIASFEKKRTPENVKQFIQNPLATNEPSRDEEDY